LFLLSSSLLPPALVLVVLTTLALVLAVLTPPVLVLAVLILPVLVLAVLTLPALVLGVLPARSRSSVLALVPVVCLCVFLDGCTLTKHGLCIVSLVVCLYKIHS
jgi:hypothetical protein